MVPQNINYREFIGTLAAVIVALTVHEYAHARMADKCGDGTPRAAGRLSLNPLDHLDVFGTLMIIWMSLGGFGLGWARPVPVNPYNFRHPRADNIKVSLAGVATNMAVAVVLAIPFMLGLLRVGPFDYAWLLAFFNVIPIPPLDGSHVLATLLPLNAARAYEQIVGRFGFLILILLLTTGVIGSIIGPPAFLVLRILHLY
jgi:Zn-dependent protease